MGVGLKFHRAALLFFISINIRSGKPAVFLASLFVALHWHELGGAFSPPAALPKAGGATPGVFLQPAEIPNWPGWARGSSGWWWDGYGKEIPASWQALAAEPGSEPAPSPAVHQSQARWLFLSHGKKSRSRVSSTLQANWPWWINNNKVEALKN